MALQHMQTITIDDERYPGQVANVVAMDWAFTPIARTTTLLLRSGDGSFTVHYHTAPAGFDQIHTIDERCAVALYKRMHVHIAPFAVFGWMPA